MTKIITPPIGMELDPKTKLPDITPKKRQTIAWVIGVFDSNGKIDHRTLKLGDTRMHGCFWPDIHHKRWRYSIYQGDINALGQAWQPDPEEYGRIIEVLEKLKVLREWTRFYAIINGYLPYPPNSRWRKATKVTDARSIQALDTCKKDSKRSGYRQKVGC